MAIRPGSRRASPIMCWRPAIRRWNRGNRVGLLDGKAAVVTGAGRVIGRGHVLHLAANGARVLVNDIDAAAAERVAVEARETGGNAVACADDIASRTGAESLIGRAVQAFGGIDILVNNAGNLRDRSFL